MTNPSTIRKETMPHNLFPESSSVRRVFYNENENVMEVTYANGRKYRYDDVPETVFESILAVQEAGGSVGGTVTKLVVRGGFEFEEVTA